jgi:hypothetical protein
MAPGVRAVGHAVPLPAYSPEWRLVFQIQISGISVGSACAMSGVMGTTGGQEAKEP